MIIRTPSRDRFVMVAKESIEDDRLSWKARGLLTYLLSKPDSWIVYTAQLVKAAPDGRASVMSGLAELEQFGYITRQQTRDPTDGRFDSVDTTVHEIATKPQVGPGMQFSVSGKPVSGKPATSKDLQAVKTYKSKSPPKKTRATPFPSGRFRITPEMKDWVFANKLEYLDIQNETAKFKDYALANNRRYIDWVAAWRNWIRNAAKFNPPAKDRQTYTDASGNVIDL